MHKYLQLIKISWSNQLVYRVSVLFWRIRQILATILALSVWQTIYQTTETVQSYDQQTMVAYVFLTNIVQSVLLSTSLFALPRYIWEGTLSNELLKPVSLYWYFGVQDIADKLRNTLFVLAESGFLYWIFQPTIALPSVSIGVLFAFWTLAGAFLYFWINLLFGAIGFFSPDTWGPRFLFFVILDFSAGKLFPLDILPQAIQNVLFFTPFPYLGYVQTQLFLGRLDSQEQLQITLSLGLLLAFFVGITQFIWSRSIREYGAVGG